MIMTMDSLSIHEISAQTRSQSSSIYTLTCTAKSQQANADRRFLEQQLLCSALAGAFPEKFRVQLKTVAR